MTGYSPRQRQRIRERLNKHRYGCCQWWESWLGWDGEGIIRVPVSAREAAQAAVYGYASVTLDAGDGRNQP